MILGNQAADTGLLQGETLSCPHSPPLLNYSWRSAPQLSALFQHRLERSENIRL